MPLPRPPDAAPPTLDAPPPVLELAQAALAPLQQHLVPLMLAGCWSFVDLAVVSVFAGVEGVVLFGLIAAKADPMIMVAVMLLGGLAVGAAMFTLFGGTMVAMLRVVADLLDRGEPPSFQAMLRYAPGSISTGAPALLVVGLLSMLGALFCYLPGMIVSCAFSLLLAIRLDHDSLGESLSVAWRYFRAFPSWHAGIFGVNIVFGLLAGSIPFVGYALYIPAHALLITAAWRALRQVRIEA